LGPKDYRSTGQGRSVRNCMGCGVCSMCYEHSTKQLLHLRE